MRNGRTIKRHLLLRACEQLRASPEQTLLQLRHVLDTMAVLSRSGFGIVANSTLHSATGFAAERNNVLIWALDAAGLMKMAREGCR